MKKLVLLVLVAGFMSNTMAITERETDCSKGVQASRTQEKEKVVSKEKKSGSGQGKGKAQGR